MHEDYGYDYDEEDDDYENSHDDLESQYKKFYFKFDPTAWDTWAKWMQEAIDDVVQSSPNIWYVMPEMSGIPPKSLPVNSYFSNTGKEYSSCQYLGINYQNQEVWKSKYFVYNPINTEYSLHIQSHAKHFLQQPNYYKGLFDILN